MRLTEQSAVVETVLDTLVASSIYCLDVPIPVLFPYHSIVKS